jgi:hypothetical protein
LCVSVCGPVYALVYPTVTGRSSCCVCLYVVPSVRWCIPQWRAVLLVVCVCMWSRLCASVSHSDGPFFLLCCVCMWSRLCANVSHSGGPFFLLCCVCMWSRLCAGVSHSDGPFFLLCCVCVVDAPKTAESVTLFITDGVIKSCWQTSVRLMEHSIKMCQTSAVYSAEHCMVC